MRASERDAAQQRIRERQRRANRMLAVRTIAGLIGYSVGFPLGRMLVHHQPFNVATMGLCAVGYTAVTALIWGGFLGWDRWRHRRRAA